MRQHKLLIISIFALAIVGGCSYFDRRAFEKAEMENTEEAYQEYIQSYSQGRYIAEAKKLADLRAFERAKAENTIEAFQRYLEDYNLYKKEAREKIAELRVHHYQIIKERALEAEKEGDWRRALALWSEAKDYLNLDEDDKDYLNLDEDEINNQIKACKQELARHIATCTTIIENPIEISGEKVIAFYRPYFDGRAAFKYSSVRVRGKVTNNCPFPVYEIVLHLALYARSPLEVNMAIGEDVRYGKDVFIDSVERTICHKKLQPGETRTFSFWAPISADLNLTEARGENLVFYDLEGPLYSLEVKSYKIAQ